MPSMLEVGFMTWQRGGAVLEVEGDWREHVQLPEAVPLT